MYKVATKNFILQYKLLSANAILTRTAFLGFIYESTLVSKREGMHISTREKAEYFNSLLDRERERDREIRRQNMNRANGIEKKKKDIIEELNVRAAV
jgi:hypothetical protein